MIVRMHVQHKGNTDGQNVWIEEFDSENTRCLRHYDASLSSLEYSEAVIMFFNNTLKPGERERILVGAVQIEEFSEK